jgi:cyclin T
MASWIVPEDVLINSPSREDGVSKEEERQLRQQAILFVNEACNSKDMKVPKVAAATASVFFHRFFALQSFRKHSQFDIAVACIFLAAKVEESPRKIQDVIKVSFLVWNNRPLEASAVEYESLRVRILKCERILLQTLNFDLCVDHPYRFLIDTVKSLNVVGIIEEKKKKDFAQRAVNFLNDSLRTNLCLRFPPQKIASACIYMSGAYLDLSILESKAIKWDDKLAIEEEELVEITDEILSIYQEA